MAVKIVRQPNRIALLGSPTSAAALSEGHERAPEALRAAGLTGRLRAAGYEVTDLGDDPMQVYKPDEESPRARNLPAVIQALDALKLRVEQAVKSGALPLILAGDCSTVLGTIAGVRRYFRHVSLLYMDSDADLNTPATTPSGCVDGMVISHIIGRGAAEMVRFWPEPPLVREPDVALFGITRVEQAEEEALQKSPVRRYLASEVRRMGAAAAARAAIERIHGAGNEFVLHLDVDVISGFQATNYPSADGLALEDAREALEVFATQKHLAAIQICAYNPAKDPDGGAAKVVVDLVAGILAKRLETAAVMAPAEAGAAEARTAPPAPSLASSAEAVPALTAAIPGEARPSDALEGDTSAAGPAEEGSAESEESSDASNS